MWPNESLLESLITDLKLTEQSVEDYRRNLLESRYDSSYEQALVDKCLEQRSERDALVVEACTKLLAALEASSCDAPDAIKTLPEFETLNSLLPVPNGVLKPVRNQPRHLLLTNFLTAQRQRHEPLMARATVIKAVRAQHQKNVEESDELRAAREAALVNKQEIVARNVERLVWSDHVPILALLQSRRASENNAKNFDSNFESVDSVAVLGWNVLERKSNGIKPVLPLFSFWSNRTNNQSPAKKMSFKLPKNTTACLQQALLNSAAIQAHAKAVARWALSNLRSTNNNAPNVNAVCLSEVGAPVVNALRQAIASIAEAPVMSVSAPTEHLTAHPQTAAIEACEARTVVLAPADSQTLPDVRVQVGNKVRHLACVQLRREGKTDVVVVAVHVPRMAGCDSRCPRAGGGLSLAGQALRDLQSECGLPVLGVGDWNGNVALVPPGLQDEAPAGRAVAAKPGKPTTFADTVIHPESNGIDGALALFEHDDFNDSGSVNTELTVKCFDRA